MKAKKKTKKALNFAEKIEAGMKEDVKKTKKMIKKETDISEFD